MTEYDPLYGMGYEEFIKFFPNFQEKQEEAARQIWSRVLNRCGKDPGMPAIDCVVDLGCGDGLLTNELAKLAKNEQSRNGKPIRFFGLDNSENAIQKAGRPNGRVTFRRIGKDPHRALRQLTRVYDIKWESTALVCLSHTWFHLSQYELGRILCDTKLRPVLLVIDVFHSWDVAIKEILSNKLKAFHEGGRKTDNGGPYWLRTEWVAHSGCSRAIKRGLWHETAEGSNENPWIIDTTQYALSTVELFGEVDPALGAEVPVETEAGRVIEDAKGRGIITGGCDYLHRKLFRHLSGWDDMVCHVLVARQTAAVKLNQAYFRVVCSIARELLIPGDAGPPGKPPHRKPQHRLLKLFDDRSDEANPNPQRAGVIVLPFDPHTTFARIIGLRRSPNDDPFDDNEISRHDLIVERPCRTQTRFPTAFSLFHTIEDHVSSPLGFTLDQAIDYESALTDRAFDVLEEVLLPRNPDEKPAYFMLPVFFGSLPLFAIALKFPEGFDPAFTSFHVYLSTLTNLLDEIRTAFVRLSIGSRLLRPFIAEVLTELRDDRRTVTEKLKVIEAALFGEPIDETPRVLPSRLHDPRFDYDLDDHRRSGGAIAKEWKSWLLGIPSLPIKRLESVKARNSQLWSLWCAERDIAAEDAASRLSYWFQQGRFFDPAVGDADVPEQAGAGHDFWNCTTHRPRVIEMLQIAGAGQTWDSAELAGLAYFAGTSRHFLFQWMVTVLGEAFRKSDATCSAAGNCPHLTSIPDHFANLKAVFCKANRNKGTKVRFGLRRLHCLMVAACGSIESISPNDATALAQQCVSWKKEHEGVGFGDDDPSLDFAEFVAALRNFLREMVKVKVNVVTAAAASSGLIDVILSVSSDKPVESKRGGSDFNPLAAKFGIIKRYTKGELPGRAWEFQLSIVWGSDGIEFRVKSALGATT